MREGNDGQEEPALRGVLAVAGGQLRVVGGVINLMRIWELLILVVNEVGVFICQASLLNVEIY